MNGQAGPSGASVSLASDNTAATVTSSVTVAAGKRSAGFPVTTSTVAVDTVVHISGTYRGVTKVAELHVIPAVELKLAVMPPTIPGGDPALGEVAAIGSNGSGATVNLSSDNAAASVPSTVTIAIGKVGAGFKIATTNVTTQTVATITATLGSSTATAKLTIVPVSILGAVVIPFQVVGGTSATLYVKLNAPAPVGGASVTLTSDNSAATVPGTVTVDAGKTIAKVTVTTTAVSVMTTVHFTATYNGKTVKAFLVLTK